MYFRLSKLGYATKCYSYTEIKEMDGYPKVDFDKVVKHKVDCPEKASCWNLGMFRSSRYQMVFFFFLMP